MGSLEGHPSHFQPTNPVPFLRDGKKASFNCFSSWQVREILWGVFTGFMGTGFLWSPHLVGFSTYPGSSGTFPVFALKSYHLRSSSFRASRVVGHPPKSTSYLNSCSRPLGHPFAVLTHLSKLILLCLPCVLSKAQPKQGCLLLCNFSEDLGIILWVREQPNILLWISKPLDTLRLPRLVLSLVTSLLLLDMGQYAPAEAAQPHLSWTEDPDLSGLISLTSMLFFPITIPIFLRGASLQWRLALTLLPQHTSASDFHAPNLASLCQWEDS